MRTMSRDFYRALRRRLAIIAALQLLALVPYFIMAGESEKVVTATVAVATVLADVGLYFILKKLVLPDLWRQVFLRERRLWVAKLLIPMGFLGVLTTSPLILLMQPGLEAVLQDTEYVSRTTLLHVVFVFLFALGLMAAISLRNRNSD